MRILSKFNRYLNKISPYKDFSSINRAPVFEHYLAGYEQCIKDFNLEKQYKK